MRVKNHLKKYLPILAIFPLIIGTYGYITAGERPSDALYAAFALYFVNPVSDGYNFFIEIARWTAALVTTTAILSAVRWLWTRIKQWAACIGKDSVAVYSDNDIAIDFKNKRNSVIYANEEFKPLAKSHIIMMSSDKKSLDFLADNKERIKGKMVYIPIRELKTELSKEQSDNVIFFDVNGAVAGLLWEKIKLWEKGKLNLVITIIGAGNLGQSVLNCGLTLNLFSCEQEITYNFLGFDNTYAVLHGDINTCNKDRICYYAAGEEQNAVRIKNSNYVIICAELSEAQLQAVMTLCSGELYVYSPTGGICEYFNFKALHTFGENSRIFTEENICGRKHIRAAMEINYNYLKRLQPSSAENSDAETEWNKLNGFLKQSNISSAAFFRVIKALADDGTDRETLARLEHIRWCRFHYLNFWTYSPRYDSEKKLHPCLLPFDELPQEERNKDRNLVDEILSKYFLY